MTLICLLISANSKAVKLYEKNGYILQNNETFQDNKKITSTLIKNLNG